MDNVMSFDAFRSTRQLMSTKLYCEKYGLHTDDIESPFVFNYEGFHIEFDPKNLIMFFLVLNRWDMYSNDIENLEKELYDYAVDEIDKHRQMEIELNYKKHTR